MCTHVQKSCKRIKVSAGQYGTSRSLSCKSLNSENPGGEAKQSFDQYGTEERLRRWREFDPEAAAQVEQKRRKLSVRPASDEAVSPTR